MQVCFAYLQDLFVSVFLLCTQKISLYELSHDASQVISLVLIGISSAVLGVFLVLRKMTMLANSLSHTMLIGVVGAYLVLSGFLAQTTLLSLDMRLIVLGAFFSSMLTMWLTTFFHKNFHLQKDASIGLVFTSLFALGVVLVTLFTKNAHIGTELIMGNIDILHADDIIPIFWLSFVNVLLVLFFYRQYVTISFDKKFAFSVSMSQSFYTYLLLLQTSITMILGFRALGLVVILALLVIPVVTARMWASRIRPMIFIAITCNVIGAVCSVGMTRYFLDMHNLPLSTSGCFVLVHFGIWLASYVIIQVKFWLQSRKWFLATCKEFCWKLLYRGEYAE